MAALMSAAEIPPGGEGTIKATIRTARRSGNLSKSITVQTSDPNKAPVRLLMKGKVIVEADLVPQRLSFGRIDMGEEVTKVAKLVARDPEKVRLTKAKAVADDANLRAKLIKVEGQDAVEVRFVGKKAGTIRGVVEVSTTSEKRPTIKLMVTGFVMGNWEVRPRTVHFPEPEEGADPPAKRTVRITQRKQTRFRVTKVTDPDGAVSSKVTKTEEGFEVEVTLNNVPEKRRGILKVSTNDPSERTIDVRYYVRRKRVGRRPALPRPVKSLRPPRPRPPVNE